MAKNIYKKTYALLHGENTNAAVWAEIQEDTTRIIKQYPPGKRLNTQLYTTTFKSGNTYAIVTITDPEAINWLRTIWLLICLGSLVALVVKYW